MYIENEKIKQYNLDMDITVDSKTVHVSYWREANQLPFQITARHSDDATGFVMVLTYNVNDKKVDLNFQGVPTGTTGIETFSTDIQTALDGIVTEIQASLPA